MVKILIVALFFASFVITLGATRISESQLDPVRYRIDPTKSTFMVHANRAGLAWFKGKSHRIAAKDFGGEVSLVPDALNPASLELSVKTASLEETDPVFTTEQKGIIKKELD